LRDTQKRGYSVEKVIEQIEARMPDAQKFIWPQRKFADIVISYFTDDSFTIGDVEAAPKVKLKLTVDSNIDLEPLIQNLEREGLRIEHNYTEDLSTHYIVVDEIDSNVNFGLLADRIVRNKEEIIHRSSTWTSDFRGLIQLVILLMLSEKMKEIKDDEI
jgi:hypothetical protein